MLSAAGTILNIKRDEKFLFMSSTYERCCVGCGSSDEVARLDRCPICSRYFCADCAYRASGRRFCSDNCARTYNYGDPEDDDQNPDYDD